MSKEAKAILLLLLITIFWGLTFPITKSALTYISPATFIVLRFTLAALILLPLIIKDCKQRSLITLKAGLILGLLNSISYLAPAIGLKTIDAAQAAFIVGTSVIFTPMLLPLLKLGKIYKIDIIAALLFLVGLFIFTAFATTIKIGSIWCLLSAISFSLSIVFLQYVTQQEKLPLWSLSFYQIFFVLPLPFIMSVGDKQPTIFTPTVLIAILFCAIFATSIALVVQTKYQRFVTATKATLIYSLEPVFATLFAWMINHEAITPLMIIGGTIMLGSALLHVVGHRQVTSEEPREKRG